MRDPTVWNPAPSLTQIIFSPTQISFHLHWTMSVPLKQKKRHQVCPVRAILFQTNTLVKFPEFLQSETSLFPPCVSQSAIFNPWGVRGQLPPARPNTSALLASSQSVHSWLQRCRSRRLHYSGGTRWHGTVWWAFILKPEENKTQNIRVVLYACKKFNLNKLH